jgi:hypothetical protein
VTVSGNHTVSAVFLLLEFSVGSTPEHLELKLKRNGVAKGTICKMKTVLQALRDGKITTDDVKSLNHAYNLAKAPDPSEAHRAWLTDLRGQFQHNVDDDVKNGLHDSITKIRKDQLKATETLLRTFGWAE